MILLGCYEKMNQYLVELLDFNTCISFSNLLYTKQAFDKYDFFSLINKIDELN